MSEIIYYKPGPKFEHICVADAVINGQLVAIPALKIPEVEGLTLIKDLNQKIKIAREALEFYADPENYHAILILPDRPSGAFADDFSDHGHPNYDRQMPGKTAREALEKLAKL